MARIPIALQLWSVREDCKNDLPKTLEALAKMGYEGVEFAGFHGYTSAQINKMLKDNGLRVAGSHTPISLLQGDEFAGTVEFNQALGNKYVVVPSLSDNMWNSKNACLQTAAVLNELADKLANYGMAVGFHNHAGELRPLPVQAGGPISPYDCIFGATKQEVVMQIDIGHAMRGGGDPVALIQKYPGRAKTVHVKEYSPEDDAAVIGAGIMPWPQVFAACETVGATEWYIVEHEKYNDLPLVCVEQCINALRQMGK